MRLYAGYSHWHFPLSTQLVKSHLFCSVFDRDTKVKYGIVSLGTIFFYFQKLFIVFDEIITKFRLFLICIQHIQHKCHSHVHLVSCKAYYIIIDGRDLEFFAMRSSHRIWLFITFNSEFRDNPPDKRLLFFFT